MTVPALKTGGPVDTTDANEQNNNGPLGGPVVNPGRYVVT